MNSGHWVECNAPNVCNYWQVKSKDGRNSIKSKALKLVIFLETLGPWETIVGDNIFAKFSSREQLRHVKPNTKAKYKCNDVHSLKKGFESHHSVELSPKRVLSLHNLN